MRQAKNLFQEIANEHPNDLELIELITTFDACIENYQESIHSELLAKQELDMAIEKRDAAFAELDRMTDEIRNM